MAFPPAHLLVGMGVAEVVRSAAPPLSRRRAWLLAAGLAMSPDLDFVLGIALRRGAAYHGTFTHSVVAVLAVAAVVAAVAGARWAVLAGAGYGSHLVVDLLDDRGRTNVLLAWPFSDERPFAIARVFPKVPFQGEEGLREAVLSLARPDVVLMLLVQTGMGLLVFLALFALARVIRLLRGRHRTLPRP
ncbi:MAG TPA: metal-dependent hydrolase [Longimicrobiaceae bacterium]